VADPFSGTFDVEAWLVPLPPGKGLIKIEAGENRDSNPRRGAFGISQDALSCASCVLIHYVA
jgi:hypothetical protein